jgi:prevent-host-death family protein
VATSDYDVAMSDPGTVGIRELKDSVSSIIERVESGETITVTRRSKPVARIVAAATPPRLAALIAEGAVRPGDGTRYLPRATKLRGPGRSAADYVSEGRR